MHILLIAKVKILGLSKFHRVTTTPLLATLLWPFFLKLLMSLRPIQDIVNSMVHDSRLFMFQLSQIIHLDDIGEGERRFSRVRRLLHNRLVNTGRSIAFVEDEHSLHTVSMVAL
ncbi:hypothetical protein HanXRQr2_Chr03g0132201 [Helianthus annuus]|uniref:Uncharacterized protein n=1 Tax=Helianthus annuus TaxID=4232 RepID=A0A9K3NXM3_HELAN|nr:hypothetical protein HanXRQr2_Chr03g0132201 [Helianthus annuus]KAJ0609617.1 hypothetical protein HanHA89_Chr03g0121951 [Helianthus annuus]KAJ0769658.1 hypothetical protein HanLR1_Chr03g0115171 [Helianthus annuus]KAJ0775393.1 hypothetical protein HanOQP8_Chr03g0122441 [Helianthus annuus]